MTSDEDYYPPNESTSDRRQRSNRITRRRARKTKIANVRKSSAKSKKTFMTTKKSKKSPRIAEKGSEDISGKGAGTFSSEPLIPAELHQLYTKFKKDGHFRCVSSNSSSTCPKSRTTDGKPSVKRKKPTGEVTATVTSQRTSMENNIRDQGIPQHVTNPLSITFSNPLPNASGSMLHISPDKNSYIPLIPPDQYNHWNKPMLRQNFLSAGTFKEKNGIDLSSNRHSVSNFVPPKQYQSPSITNSYKQVLNKPNWNSAWRSFDDNEPSNPWNQANPCGLYYQGNNSQMGYNGNSTSAQINLPNRENIGIPYENNPKPPSLQIYENNVCSGFSQTGNAPGSFPSRQMNLGTPAYVSQNESPYGNLPSNWVGTAVNNVSSTFTNNSLSTSDLTDSQNSLNYLSPDLRGYNSKLKSVNNFISSGGFGENENSINGQNSDPSTHYMSLMPWKSLQVLPNLCSTGSELSYCNDLHNFPVSPCQPDASMLIDEPKNIDNTPTYWMQNDLSHRGVFVNVDNEVSSSVCTYLPNTVAATTTTATTLNEATEVVSINGNDTDDSTLFIDDISKDIDISQVVSSFSSYEDDINYENYVDDSIPYNENSVSTTMNLDRGSNSGLLTTIKTEVRPLYDTSNYSQYNNNSTVEKQSSIFYDLGTKRELENSLDRIILQQNSTIS